MEPLSGIRVVEIAGLSTAYGMRMLAGLGAEVIKVEPPTGDQLRTFPPLADGVDAPENGLWFAHFATGKKSVVIDTTTAVGREQLQALVASADVVAEDLGEAGLADVGLDDAALRAEHPGLTWASVTPFGRTGPKKDWKGSNLVAWAACGVLYTVGFPERAPVLPGGVVQVACHITSLHASIGVQLALRAQRLGGPGQLVDVSMQDCCVAVAPETGPPLFLDDTVHRPRSGNRRPIVRPFGIYPCADGYISFLALLPAHWTAMAQWIHEATGNETVIEEVFNEISVRSDTMDLIDGWTEELSATMTKRELFLEGQRRGIPTTPVNTIADLVADEHLNGVDFWEDVDHPALGTVQATGAPMRANPWHWLSGRAPLLGEHTDEVLGALS